MISSLKDCTSCSEYFGMAAYTSGIHWIYAISLWLRALVRQVSCPIWWQVEEGSASSGCGKLEEVRSPGFNSRVSCSNWVTPGKPPPSLGSVSVQQKECTEVDGLEGSFEVQSLWFWNLPRRGKEGTRKFSMLGFYVPGHGAPWEPLTNEAAFLLYLWHSTCP